MVTTIPVKYPISPAARNAAKPDMPRFVTNTNASEAGSSGAAATPRINSANASMSVFAPRNGTIPSAIAYTIAASVRVRNAPNRSANQPAGAAPMAINNNGKPTNIPRCSGV